MDPINVFIEINGKMTKAGSLFGNDYRDARFAYDDTFLHNEYARAISISLPMQEEAFDPSQTKSYFESLLPEGFSRRAVASWTKNIEEDYISLLECLGKECIGAIKITKGAGDDLGGYEEIDNATMIRLAKEGATKSTEMLLESHISLAGASGKVGLYYDSISKKWYRPQGVAASTHIVKQSHVRLDHLVLNEQLCMLTAKRLGIDVANSCILNVGSGNDEEILYVTERFDREKREGAGVLESPFRLHQEDFAQALGIPSSKKYETEDDNYLAKIFNLINDYSANPMEDGLKLWDRIVFNYLIGNTDAHIKNYSLLYTADLKSIRLAPAYDIICTRIYGSRNDMSMYIDGEIDCTKINRSSFVKIASELNIGQKIAMKHYDFLKENIARALKESIEELCAEGFEEAVGLGERILDKCMI